MTPWRIIIGPPGTGKTTRLLSLLAEELQAGTPPDRIAFLTFTRAARQEALERVQNDLGLTTEDLPWFRTIHSAAYRLLGLIHDQVMHAGRWREFADRYHYDLSEYHESEDDAPGEPPRRTDDDDWRAVMMWGANRRITLDRALSRFGGFPLSVSQSHLFAERARVFKEEHHLLDFADILTRALIGEIIPAVDVVFVDEAQDLSPLQIALVEKWAAPCRRVYVAGDDDQAIYAFHGAEPDWLVGLARLHPAEVLAQSHRVPVRVHDIARRVITGNRDRLPKTYEPTGEQGEVDEARLDDALRQVDGSVDTLLLVRNRIFLQSAARTLFDRCVPYIIEGAGGINPYGARGAFEAISAAHTLSRVQPIPAEALRALLALIPSRGASLIPHGVKAKVDRATGVLHPHVLREELGLGDLLDRVATQGPTAVLLKMSEPHRMFFNGVIRRFGEVPRPQVRLTTIHGAKGREADHVIVLPDMTSLAYAEHRDHSGGGFEAENRVAYVAVTRAKRCLTLVRPQTRRAFSYPAVTRTGPVTSVRAS